MAASNSSRSHGVKIEDYPNHRYARGTREALTDHGITRAGPFPGDPGEKKTICNTTDPQGRPISIRRYSKTRFGVYRDWSEEEKILIEARRAREKKIEQAFALVNSWPTSADAFRESALFYADIAFGGLESRMVDGWLGGYRLSDDAARRFDGLVDEMMALIQTETIVMDQALRDKHTPACVFEAVKAAEESALAQYGGNVIPFRR